MTTDLARQSSGDLIPAGASPLAHNPAAVYLAGLAAGSRRGQRQALNTIYDLLSPGQAIPPSRPKRSDYTDSAIWLKAKEHYKALRLDYDSRCLAFPWQDLRYQHAAAIRAQLISLYKPATVIKILSALRKVLKAARRLGLMGAEDYQAAVDLERVEGQSLLSGRLITDGEKAALMAACESDPTRAGVRDAAIISLMLTAGPRRAEVISLDLADYTPDSQSAAIKILGKRQKARIIYITNGALDAMTQWLAIRGAAAGPLFLAIDKAGKIDPLAGRMTPQAIYNLLEKRGKEAGVTKFSPHDSRRTFVSDLLGAGVDVSTVARMAGHSSVNTTARYDRRPEQAKQRAAGLLHIPYHPRNLKGLTNG